MLRGKKARFECVYGCCREWRRKKDKAYRAREKRAWKKDAS